jgi:hypothetical protein
MINILIVTMKVVLKSVNKYMIEMIKSCFRNWPNPIHISLPPSPSFANFRPCPNALFVDEGSEFTDRHTNGCRFCTCTMSILEFCNPWCGICGKA